ncbi:MAG TPA: GMC family oxidoreductase N-terminal domain-containing protein [Polyangiaceae bacterium]|jgi:choline dehydrogenase-like flavoprotein
MTTYDYVVIGAGSAGCVVAHRLGEDRKTRVLVIDAGSSDDSPLFRRPGMLALIYQIPKLKEKSDWGYKTTPQRFLDGRQMPWTRSKITGGCSSVNGMLYIRGHRDNYDGWRDLGNPGWGYDDVLPYFKKSESHEDGASEFHGGSGPLQVSHQRDISVVSKAFMGALSKVCGVPEIPDFNGAVQEGASTYQMTCANRRRSSTSVAFLQPALGWGNVEHVSQALVTRIGVEKGRARSVSFLKDGQERTVYADGEIILSGGVIGSPQILMLSGIGPAAHLRERGIDVVADLPGVGKNLHDHLMVPLRFHATKDTGHTSTPSHFIAGMLNDFLFNKGWIGKTFLEGGAFVKSAPGRPRPDIQFHSIPWAYPEPNDDGPEEPTICKTASFTILPGLIYPESRGEILLRSKDPSEKPLIDPHYLEAPYDMQVLLAGIRMAREIAKTEPLAGFLKAEATPGPDVTSEDALRAAVRLYAKTIYHPVGTCKMGNDAAAVVDAQLRVHGIEGLRVADASIMPSITGGNTNAPSIMIGERAAEFVRASVAPSRERSKAQERTAQPMADAR